MTETQPTRAVVRLERDRVWRLTLEDAQGSEVGTRDLEALTSEAAVREAVAQLTGHGHHVWFTEDPEAEGEFVAVIG